MGSTLIGLATAVVGVTGTLIASVLSQRMVARLQADQFERQQRVAETQWHREQDVAELARRREAYRRIMCLEEGSPDPDGSFDDIRTDFVGLWEQWERMRTVMRAGLGVGLDAAGHPAIAP